MVVKGMFFEFSKVEGAVITTRQKEQFVKG